MELLKKLGDFVKIHYEKILLSVVLLALAAAAAYLPMKISDHKRKLEDIRKPRPVVAAKPSKAADLSTNIAVLEHVQKLPELRLTRPHNLLNPVTWRKTPDGRLIKIDTEDKEGPGALQVTKISPLHFTISYSGISGGGDFLRYQFVVRNEGDTNRTRRANRMVFVSPGGKNEKNDYFVLRDIIGPPANPNGFVLELVDGKETVEVTKTKPFDRIAGYAADLSYPLEAGRTFLDKRVKDPIKFGGGEYNIVAINQNEVTVQASSNKRTTIRFTAPNVPNAANASR